MVHIPAFPAWSPAPARQHWALGLLAFIARVIGWLVLASVLVFVLMFLVAISVFLPIMRGGGPNRRRTW